MTVPLTAPSGPLPADPLSLVAAYSAALPPALFDEMVDGDAVRDCWAEVAAGLDALGPAGLPRLRSQVERLLDDDGVTYTPVERARTRSRPNAPAQRGAVEPKEVASEPSSRQRWQLDPVPQVLGTGEWTGLAAALAQRSTLLDLVLTDLYGPRTLIHRGFLPPEVVFGSRAYLRPAHGLTLPGPHQLFLHAADVVRGPDGRFLAMGDRTEAPSGAGYAMADRRVIARVMPDVVRRAGPESLAPFFRSFLVALQSVAPRAADDPRIVVLSPGSNSETAFDQAFLAGLLGLPLVESEDLTVREGRVWMRGLGRQEPVDVILRRVDADYADPLDLRPESRLGVVGLVQACRRGNVSVVNTLGSGILENPGLLPFLPTLSETLLGEPLKLPSVPTFWCGEPSALSHVLAGFDDMVLRPVDGVGRGRIVGRLDRSDAAALRDRVRAEPFRWVGQPYLPFSVAPVVGDGGLEPGQVGMRLFAVAQPTGYLVMPGGLGRVLPLDQQTRRDSSVTAAKDVWIGSGAIPAGAAEPTSWSRETPSAAGRAAAMSSPRALEDLFWFGRYAERTEDFARLLIAAWDRSDDFRQRGSDTEDRVAPALLAIVTHASATYPGFTGNAAELVPEMRSLVLDGRRAGTLAQSLRGLTQAANGVRDQLSRDTWLVLAGIERSLSGLRDDPTDRGGSLQKTHAAVLSGMLALSGLAAENMIRDPGWYLMDIGRRIERSLQLVTVLRWALARARPAAVEEQLVESVLQFAESIVTHRRRYRGRTGIDTVLELLLLDSGNPRSLAFQLQACGADLRALPDASGTALPDRLLDDLVATLRRCDVAELSEADSDGDRADLVRFLVGVQDALTDLAAAVATQRFRHPAPMQQLDRPLHLRARRAAG